MRYFIAWFLIFYDRTNRKTSNESDKNLLFPTWTNKSAKLNLCQNFNKIDIGKYAGTSRNFQKKILSWTYWRSFVVWVDFYIILFVYSFFSFGFWGMMGPVEQLSLIKGPRGLTGITSIIEGSLYALSTDFFRSAKIPWFSYFIEESGTAWLCTFLTKCGGVFIVVLHLGGGHMELFRKKMIDEFYLM